MMRALRLVSVGALLTLLCGPGPGHGVSYFGDSFCRIQSIQDVSNFHLSLQFKTSRRSGLLLLAAGMEDYLFLELQHGKLHARLNIGAGEMTLSSTVGVQMNNLIDHKVSITLQDSNLTMAIDGLYVTHAPVTIAEEELNIDMGIWLGGTGELDAPYLSNAIPPFRGCMTDVKFESHGFDILSSELMDCYSTKESCSSEFDGGDGEAISFISPDSFVSFSTWSGTIEAARTLDFLMKTTIEDALLVFHPGRESDFIAVGIVKGFLKGVADLGSGIEMLENNKVQLDDDQWHRIRVDIDLNVFKITIDSQLEVLQLDGSQSLDLVGNLYLGGIQGKMKDLFRESGILNRMEDTITSESFIGCLSEIKVNQKEKNLQDALVTKDIHVKCEGEDYDYSSYYDQEATTTTAPVRITYVVDPTEQHCYPTDNEPEIFQNITKLLDVTSLLVPEGGEAFLDVNNLSPTFDLDAVGMRQSQIIFTLKNHPWYGVVDINTNTKRTQKFTLLDIANKKIKYLHDGNETYRDQIQLEVVAHSTGYLPECLKTGREYNLPVDFIPVNDIPQLSGEDISITENGRTRLSPSLIKIVDSDTRCDDLSVTVTEPNIEVGYLENIHQPGRSISEFTCRQLKDGNIYFIHRGGSDADLTLELSDGHLTSDLTTFKLSVTQPHLTIVTNTGLRLMQGSASSIGIQELSVIGHPRNGDILYNITLPMRFGELQIVTSNGVPKQVTTFHQSDIDKGHLRYVSTDSSVQEDIIKDYIRFDTNLGRFSLQNNTFLVEILPAHVRAAIMVPLEMLDEDQKTITHRELEAEVIGRSLDPENIKFILVKPPTFGTLELLDRKLIEGNIFTQEDIFKNHVSYKIPVPIAVDSEDHFQFRILAEDQYSPVYTYLINIHGNSDTPILINYGLVVLQGDEAILNKTNLWVQASFSTGAVYRVTQDPKHGNLIRESPPGQPRFEGAIRVFGSEDLQMDRLIYKHDGTKTAADEFHFTVLNEARHGSNWDSGQHIFKITIKSKNEHVPVRVVDKVFNLVRHGQHLLTTDIIQFKDDDSDFNDTQIVYAREGILSGNIVSTSNPSKPLFRFTQADLRDKNVLFIHHGADMERFQLQVSDGFHMTTALLQIQAGEPYLRVVNNTMIVIDNGSTKTLNTTLLSADTNMDIREDREIKFDITSPPTEGRIIVSGVEASQFTQEDLKKGVVSYENNYESLRSKDSFGFTVQANGYSEQGTFRIKIFKQGYLSEPEVINNAVIVSYEGEHTIINQDYLKVDQVDILPSEMVYTIKEHPRLGHVVMLTNNSDSTIDPVLNYIHSFTQEDINLGRIVYVSASIQGEDVFTADVNNGFTTVEDLQVSVNIVPRVIPVRTHNFTVREGTGMPIGPDILNISHPFYSSASIDFIVEEPPEHGDIRYMDGSDQDLTYFTWEEVKLGHIYYMHDGTESTADSFTLSATAYEIQRRSLPVSVSVTVTAVNDEPPKLTRNTGLEVLPGEESDITANMLNTEDGDNSAEELVYHVESPAGGMVALREAPEEGIFNFTQAQINNGEVIFIHKGEESGGFSFTVTDGEHTSPLYRFVVTARPLTITMETQEELMVFPGTRQRISSANLGAVTSDDGNEISYSLARPPRFGRLIIANDRNQYEEATRFSQMQLDSGAVYYEHQMPPEPFWVVRDSVELILSSQPAPDVHHVLPITVSYYAAHRNITSQLWRNQGLEIVQGQRKAFDSSILDASNLLASVPESERGSLDVMFEIRRFPARGRITLGGQDVPRDAPFFLQQDVTRGELEYLHDDSGAPSDSFFLRARLKGVHGAVVTSPARAVVLEEVFNITVRRRDSYPPELVSIDMLLEVHQGFMTVLTQKHLNTRDEDSPPDEVRFEVTKPPGNGRLVDSRTMEPVSEFTQEMVNRGQVGFVSDGGLSGGIVEFVVTDGKHRTDPHTLHIGVLAHTLLLVKAPEIKVRQGDDQTLVTEEMLRASTGGPIEEDVLYKITNNPKYAAVMVDRQPTSAFTQSQIKEGRVSVRFIKSTSPRDSVAFVARSRAANVSSALDITVQPLADIARDPLLPRGALVQVDRKLLDATALANKTRTSPVFSVIRQPAAARFVKYRSSGAGQSVDTFSQRDLDEGRVALEIPDSAAGSEDGVAHDQARFLLKAHGVPPAECVLNFQTAPYNASGVYPATLLRVPLQTPWEDSNDLPGAGSPRATLSSFPGGWPVQYSTTTPSPGADREPMVSRRNNLWSILIPILVILLLLLLAGLLAYYLIRKNKTGKHDVQTAASKPKNGEVASTETFRKTDPANNIPMTDMDSKDADPELLQHCRTTSPALKKNQYWV